MAKLTQSALKRYGFSVWKSKKFKPKFKWEKDDKHRGMAFEKGQFRVYMYYEDRIFRLATDYGQTITTCEQLEGLYFQATGEKLTQ